jgi:enterochelin esterase-like enzyme
MAHLLKCVLRTVLVWLCMLLVLALVACAPRSPIAPRTGGLLVHDWVHGKGLEGNRLGDAADRSVHVYLPSGYFTHAARRYPVVYLLHGFGPTSGGDLPWLTPGQSLGGPPLVDAMDAEVASGEVGEMIVVMPDCANAYGGGFYVNSSVGGAWEDFVLRDLVAFVDDHYRTVPSAEGRAVIGHSMGGFGALRMAFDHPDVFGVVYALSPAGIDDMLMQAIRPEQFIGASMVRTAEELSRREHFERVAVAAGAAFSPNPAAWPLLVDLPIVFGFGGVQRVEPVARVWSSMLTTAAVPLRRQSIGKLRAIGLEVGDHEEVTSIFQTTHAMDSALTLAGIAHDFTEFHGGHIDHLRERIAKAALPFASRHLVGVVDSPISRPSCSR